MTFSKKSLGAVLAVILVAGCDGDDTAGGDGEQLDGIAGEFGSAFFAAISADPNSEPVDAQTINLAVDGTADPFNP